MNRSAAPVRWLSAAVIALGVWLIARRLPIGPWIEALRGWVGRLGAWGPIVFGFIDVAAVVALVPGSPLTMAAGAMFGLVVGTITASLASTTGAALAFLIARYLARDQVARLVRSDPRFEAIDQAISRSDWKLIGLLRLSPAVPFNLQNYLYGLTGARFWPAMLVSWIAMLPATCLFVYLGHVGGAGLEMAAGGAQRTRTPAEWAMIGVGLLATVAVTAYITHLARRALRQSTAIAVMGEPKADRVRSPAAAEPTGWTWGTIALMTIALVLLSTGVGVQFKPELLRHVLGDLIGPPGVTRHEAPRPAAGRAGSRPLMPPSQAHVAPDGPVDSTTRWFRSSLGPAAP